MKSIYIEEKIHSSLKLLASLEKKSLAEIVEEFLSLSVRKRLSDLPVELLERLSLEGGSLDFLLDKKEDVYSHQDGLEIK
ncbi:MAG: hypothetical protein HYU97_02300 [Deltaproteobacteria bacterium]|nr:hypothetical protein [Deltaproteobacteria bacterium]